jgi:hypothetical protein
VIKFRFSNLETIHEDKDLQIILGEKLSDAVTRALEGAELGPFKQHEVFKVILDGHEIHSDLWAHTRLVPENEVLICPILKSGEGGQIFKQALILTIAITATVLFPPAAFGTIGSALLIAGTTIAASLALNALIPPPALDLGDIGGVAGSEAAANSQMYAISSQSNRVNKLGSVPKVYGYHRMFPYVAANPYTELEYDSKTGELVQYLYCVFDFGFGPMMVDTLQIGDTPIGNFEDYQINWVDFNRPITSEGPWDDPLKTDLLLYKGDQEIEALSVALDKDQSDGGDPSGYQAIRNASPNTDNSKQAITVSLVNQQGLYGYDVNGKIGPRSIDLQIDFAPVGTENWKGFNDLTAVDAFESRGGDEATFNTDLSGKRSDLLGWTTNPSAVGPQGEPPVLLAAPYAVTYESPYSPPSPYSGYPTGFNFKRRIGLPAGQPYVVMGPPPAGFTPFNAAVYYQGRFLGRIVSFTPWATDNSYYRYQLDRNLDAPVDLYEFGVLAPRRRYPTNEVLPETLSGTGGAYVAQVFSNTFTVAVFSNSKARITRDKTGPAYSTYRFYPKNPGNYKVRVTRLDTTGTYVEQTQDKLTWVSLITRFDRKPIVTDKRHLFLEMKIRATNQLNGSIQNLSAQCASVLDVWNGSAWVKQVSNNPAWVVADLLTGQVNKRAISKDRLHLPSLVEWAAFADAVPEDPEDGTFFNFPRFQCNFVLDYPTTLQNVINQVTSAAQASLNLSDTRYGVLIDKLRTTPVQIFTPRNSKDFSSSRIYTEKPHGVKVKFVDPTADWGVQEVEVYDNGYNKDNSTKFDDLSTFACTNAEQAWRFGRYMIAQNRLRQETMSLTVDFEHLVCTRGDFVQITQDTMKVGGFPARVKEINGNEITIDDGLDLSGPSFGYVFRNVATGIQSGTVVIISSDTFEFDGPLPEVGDLVVIGETTRVVFDCLVKSIAPNDDLSATLILIEKADGIYDYESTAIFPEYDPQISKAISDSSAPGEVLDLVVADQGYECNGRGYLYYIDLDWDAPSTSTYETFQIFVDNGAGFSEVAATRKSMYRYVVDAGDLGTLHNFKVLAVSSTGKKRDLGTVTGVATTPTRKTASPSDVESLSTDITGEVLQLVWPQVPDCDCQEYLIRYSPALDATWESTVPLLRMDRNSTLAATQARTGTYMIKALDFNGNESMNPAVSITTVPNLFNLNVIEETTDAPDWEGTRDKVEVVGDTLLIAQRVVGGAEIAEYYSEAFYYYKNLLDLGEIYTVRLQSLIQAEGYTLGDFMASWESLADVTSLANAKFSEWDVEAQYRSTENFNTIADWASLADVPSMASGEVENFTEWRKFIMGDATGRIFQFRLRLLSNKVNVTPRVFDGTIRADMPDRIESYNNLQADDTNGYILSYAPAFAGPLPSPNVQITIDDAESGDYISYDYKTIEGFQIRFFDKNNTQVARQFDVQVKGYGRKAVSVI